MQLAQKQVLGACLIIRAFKATSAQGLNIEAYLTSIDFELDKKADQTTAYLYSRHLYHMLTQSRSIYSRQIFAPLEVLEKCYAKLFGNNIHKLEKKSAYIMALWWQPLTINIPNSKKKVTKLYNPHLALKPLLEIVAYTDGSGINEKIGFPYVIQGESKAIKKFLEMRTCSIVYMGEFQGIQDSFSYTLSQNKSSEIRIFIDSQAALQALKNLDGCSTS